MISVKIAKYMMNILPNKPKYKENEFGQELFRNLKYVESSLIEKEFIIERWLNNNIKEGKEKPFDLFFPSISLKKMLNSKLVLDLGCGLGGKTIAWAEKWEVRELYGIDTNQEAIKAVNNYLFKNNLKIGCKFLQGYAEKLPFENEYFDAIISHDTIEHVRSVSETLMELKRVLKKGGVAFLVFPSIKFPFGGAHIGAVTRMPFLEWFFSPETLNDAYCEIISHWGDEFNWYKPTEETLKNWSVVKGGIGVNGTKYNDFMTVIREVGFSEIRFIKIPLLFVSDPSIKYPIIKSFSSILKPFLFFDFFKDYLSHRLVFILVK